MMCENSARRRNKKSAQRNRTERNAESEGREGLQGAPQSTKNRTSLYNRRNGPVKCHRGRKSSSPTNHAGIILILRNKGITFVILVIVTIHVGVPPGRNDGQS